VKKLIDTFWREPAVALGVLAAAAIVALKISGGDAVSAQDVVAILTPLATALGIRQAVTPSRPAS
jgi:hypothetical protein